MFDFEKIVEQRIAAAIERGELNHLPGVGRPLELDDDTFVPAEMRLAYRILKNAGFVPEEVSMRGQISRLEQVLGESRDEAARLRAARRLDLLRAKLSARRGREPDLRIHDAYREKLLARFSNPGPADPGTADRAEPAGGGL